ncbi:hypothetical protein RND81_03G021800 [Saponaria officinalis]|uniref:SWI/SNF complex subunit SWI3B n=1 Tax=Saponaria officinalis TaxID=3572 RepID=A0AAW1M2P5_SAPOF
MSDRLHHPPIPLPPSSTAAAPPSTSLSDANKPTPAPAPAPEPDTLSVPSYSSWFTWTGIHEVESKNLIEFFDEKSPSKTPNVYKYYRNSIIKKFRSNPSRKLTFTEVRRTIVGDVGSIRRVFDFLETWGLVNYVPPSTSAKQQNKAEDKDGKSVSAANAAANAAVSGGCEGGSVETSSNSNSSQKSRKWCSGCKTACTIACFVCDKYDLVLCARCYIRGWVGVSSQEFRRVEISEPTKTEWTDKETLNLLEAVMHYGDDWKRVAEHVPGRNEKDCVARFIKLPFGEQFVEPADLNQELEGQVNAECGAEPAAKNIRLTPLADASNPIMAQAAFLSALAGVEVSEAAAQAAVATLYDMSHLTSRGSSKSQKQEMGTGSNDSSLLHASEEARIIAERELKQEEDEFVKSISTITEVKIKDILEKIRRVKEMDCQLETEWREWQQMKHQLFLDKLSLLFHKTAAPKTPPNVTDENVRAELTTST